MEVIKKIRNFLMPVDETIIIDDVKAPTQEETVGVAAGENNVMVEEEKQVVGGQSIGSINTNPNAEAAVRRSQMTVISTGKAQNMRIQIYTPQSFDAVSEIADALKAKKSAIVNYERVEMAEQRRICDFLNGVCYVQDGEVRRVTATMVLYVPDGVEINEIKSVAPNAAPMQY